MEPVFSFIEYLVGGTVGLLWLIPLVRHLLELDKLDGKVGIPEGVFSIIFAYALGIFLDRASSFMLNPLSSRKKTREGLQKLLGHYKSMLKFNGNKSDTTRSCDSSANTTKLNTEYSAYTRTARILELAAEPLAQATQAYVGRERIARVMLLNSIAGLMVAFCLQKSFSALHILLAWAAVWSLLTWAELNTLSEQFKRVAIKEIDRKNPKKEST